MKSQCIQDLLLPKLCTWVHAFLGTCFKWKILTLFPCQRWCYVWHSASVQLSYVLILLKESEANAFVYVMLSVYLRYNRSCEKLSGWFSMLEAVSTAISLQWPFVVVIIKKDASRSVGCLLCIVCLSGMIYVFFQDDMQSVISTHTQIFCICF